MPVQTPVTITTFKKTGKSYATAEARVETPQGHFDQVIDAVRALRREKRLPGMVGVTIAGEYHVLVEVAEVGSWSETNGTPGAPPYHPGGKRLIPADEPLELPAYVPMHLR